MNYRFKYTFFEPFGHPKHFYEAVGRWGGLHFHVTDLGETHAEKYGERYSAGLEVHYRQPPDYMDDRPPSHDDCWLLKCPCWHDGTSLYAMKSMLPRWDQKNPKAVFRMLEREADERFETWLRNDAE